MNITMNIMNLTMLTIIETMIHILLKNNMRWRMVSVIAVIGCMIGRMKILKINFIVKTIFRKRITIVMMRTTTARRERSGSTIKSSIRSLPPSVPIMTKLMRHRGCPLRNRLKLCWKRSFSRDCNSRLMLMREMRRGNGGMNWNGWRMILLILSWNHPPSSISSISH